MNYLYLYLLSCVLVYIVLCIRNRRSFKDVDMMSIVRGILGTLVYPILLPLMWYWSRK